MRDVSHAEGVVPSLASALPTAPPEPLCCRSCGARLAHVMADLGASPLCESYRSAEQLREPETFYPLCAYVCSSCLLVQVQDFETPEHIFREYAYFSSFSSSWLEHARRFAEAMTERLSLNENSLVLEVASNDGYLLRHFAARRVPVLGVDPARNVAEAARRAGVPTLTEFFGRALAERLAAEGRAADLIVANNVLAHVPDINDFVAGFPLLLAPEGIISFEFPHLLELLAGRQFDTIYHEHFSYLSLLALTPVFARARLRVFALERLSTHGGSLRLFVSHAGSSRPQEPSVEALLEAERRAGLAELATYTRFGAEVVALKHDLLRLLLRLKAEGRTVVGYGAPGKGNTLLNYCGVGRDLLAYTVDRNPYKQGKFLPGTRIPIYAPERIEETRPDFVLLLPWNLETEITAQLAHIRDWGGRFIVPIPTPRIL